MIENYSVFYKFAKKHDALIVLFNYGKMPTSYNRIGDFGIVYSNDEPIAYNFFNIHKYLKIHVHSMIFAPSDALIDLLNLLLGRNFENLAYKSHSGYSISQVFRIKPLSITNLEMYYLSDGENTYLIVDHQDTLKMKDVVVIARKFTMLNNGKVFLEPHVCTYTELGIEDKNELYFIDDEKLVGKDFFKTEEL